VGGPFLPLAEFGRQSAHEVAGTREIACRLDYTIVGVDRLSLCCLLSDSTDKSLGTA